MAQEPWLKLWTRETLGALSTFTAAERGAWLSIVCVLAESAERGVKTMPLYRWAASCGCNEEQFNRILALFKNENVFDFEETPDGLKTTCRRLVRETEELRSGVKRVRNFRNRKKEQCNGECNDTCNGECNGEVTPQKKEVRSKNKESTPIGVPKKKFEAPSIDEVKAYIAANEYAVDAERWHAYYEANGWKVGRNPMKDWQAAVRTWARGDNAQISFRRGARPAATAADHAKGFFAGTGFGASKPPNEGEGAATQEKRASGEAGRQEREATNGVTP